MTDRPLVIINADDFGYSTGVNEGIKKAYEEGILTSTTVLATVVTDNASLARLHNTLGLPKPQLGIGVHLTLTLGKPLTSGWDFETFTRPYRNSNTPEEWQGSSWKKYFEKFDKKQVEKEFTAQIEKVMQSFAGVDHVDSHHGVASYPPIIAAYEHVAQQYGLAVRLLSPLSENAVYGGEFLVDNDYPKIARAKGLRAVDSVNMDYWHTKPDPIAAFLEDIKTVKPGEIKEYMFHPAADDSQGAWRMTDLAILTDKKVIDTIRNLDIELTTYKIAAR